MPPLKLRSGSYLLYISTLALLFPGEFPLFSSISRSPFVFSRSFSRCYTLCLSSQHSFNMFMRSVITLAIAATGAVAVPNAQAPPVNAGCNQDNCLRALLNPTRPAVSQCSSYFLTTVTPAAMYVSYYPCLFASGIPVQCSSANASLMTEP